MRHQPEQGGVVAAVDPDQHEGRAKRVLPGIGRSRPAAPLVRRAILAPQFGGAGGRDRDFARNAIFARGKIGSQIAKAISRFKRKKLKKSRRLKMRNLQQLLILKTCRLMTLCST